MCRQELPQQSLLYSSLGIISAAFIGQPLFNLLAIYLWRNWGGEYENGAILVAIAVNEDGYREVLGAAWLLLKAVTQQRPALKQWQTTPP